MRRLASLLLLLILAAGPAAAQAPAPVTLTALPAPDAAGRCLLRGASEATYRLTRPVLCGGVYTSVLGPEGDRPKIEFWPPTPGFLANLKAAPARPEQWTGGGVRLVRDPAATPAVAMGLRDMEGLFSDPAPGPRSFAGLRSLAYALDCSLARWDVAGTNNELDLFGLYANQLPSPVALTCSRDGLILRLADSAGRTVRVAGRYPAGTPAPGTRAAIGVAIDAVKGLATLTWGGAVIGSGAFTPPLAEGTDARMMIGAQSPAGAYATDPDMTLYAFAQIADGVTTRVTIPAAPDWFFPPSCVLASREDDRASVALARTDFRRLRIEGAPTVGIFFGGMEGRCAVSDCAIQGNVGIGAGGGTFGAVYRIDVDRVSFTRTGAAAIKVNTAILTARSIESMYPARSVTVQRGGWLSIDGLGLSPAGAPAGAQFRGLPTSGDRTVFALADAVLDYEGGGPQSYLDFDASGRTTPGGTIVALSRVAIGTGTQLATLRARPGQPPGHGTLAIRDCPSDVPGAVPASPGWTVTGTLNGQPAAAPPPAPSLP